MGVERPRHQKISKCHQCLNKDFILALSGGHVRERGIGEGVER